MASMSTSAAEAVAAAEAAAAATDDHFTEVAAASLRIDLPGEAASSQSSHRDKWHFLRTYSHMHA